MPRLGVITTGQGPRPEYERYHTAMLRRLGLADIEVRISHALDGLSLEEVDAIVDPEAAWCIGCHVEAAGGADRTGANRREVFVDRAKLIPFVQRSVEYLEREARVDATIICCCEEFPKGTFSNNRPLILPFEAVLSTAAAASAESEKRQSVVVVVTLPSAMHVRQASSTWAAFLRGQRGPKSVVVQFHPEASQLVARASAALPRDVEAPNLVVCWGYGMGIAPFDDPNMMATIEHELNAPVVTPHFVSTLRVRSLLRPTHDDWAVVSEGTE